MPCHSNQLPNEIKDLKISMENLSGNSKGVWNDLVGSKDAWKGKLSLAYNFRLSVKERVC